VVERGTIKSRCSIDSLKRNDVLLRLIGDTYWRTFPLQKKKLKSLTEIRLGYKGDILPIW
jgi:hypothetical protein